MKPRLEVGLLTGLLVYSFIQTPYKSELSSTLQTPCYYASVPTHLLEKFGFPKEYSHGLVWAG